MADANPSMQQTVAVTAYSGYVVLFDPAAVGLRGAEEPDFETLERGRTEGWLVWWPALEEYVTVLVAVDEPPPGRLLEASEGEERGMLRAPSGALWLADPAFIHPAGKTPPRAEEAEVLRVVPGEYEATVFRLAWPADAHDRYLRQAAGRVVVFARDLVAMAVFLLAAVTVIGLPVFLIGRALDDGLSGVAGGLGWAAVMLVPLWAVTLAAWRLPAFRAADEAERRSVMVFPDAAVQLVRQGG